MSEYQVLARKYRPKKFSEVLGQEAIVTTLKNAIKQQRLAHAYLFCGSRGTGKTTLARIFAKALNCHNRIADGEPCNACPSCKEIASGSSLDVLEIDGASHRGIDDIRQINETVAYATSTGGYKIYIIDEVHMLTKEAFNALLKTLEEPPPRVKFFFATTEPHKVLPTILSRCQRFNLNRIPTDKIIDKLRYIAENVNVSVEEDALRLIAQRADGGLRDAESLMDQIFAFHEGTITVESVASVLGIMPKDSFFMLDAAGKEGNLAIAFDIVHQVFSQGKDLLHFVESLTEHFRTILLFKLSGKNAPYLTLSENEKIRYEASAKIYSQEQCLTILEHLIEAQNHIRFAPSGRVALEAILLKILRIHQRVPVEYLIRRLSELEQSFSSGGETQPPEGQPKQPEKVVLPTTPSTPQVGPIQSTENIPKQQQQPPSQQNQIKELKPTLSPAPSLEPIQTAIETASPLKNPPQKTAQSISISEDPTPSSADLGIKEKKKKEQAPQTTSQPSSGTPTSPPPSPPSEEAKAFAAKKNSRYDTLMQFASVELEGTLQKKQINRL
jgi:DNA polymerase-3 subunit gamma/tau